MGKKASKILHIPIDMPMQDPFLVYVPLESLTEATIRSIISVATGIQNWDFSQRSLLIFLLAINKKLEEIENNTNENEKKLDEHIIEHAKNVRQWLVYKNQPLDWDELRQRYDDIAKLKYTDLAHYYGSKDAEPYFELRMETVSYS